MLMPKKNNTQQQQRLQYRRCLTTQQHAALVLDFFMEQRQKYEDIDIYIEMYINMI